MIEVMFGRFAKLVVAVAALGVIGFGSPAVRAQSQDDATNGGGWFDDSAAPAPSSDAQPTSDAQPEQTLAGASPQGSSDTYSDTDPSAVTDFSATLSPYGQWVQDPTYGLVWVPDESAVGPNFAPYLTSGHWAVTANGDWMWVSDYPFGWVVFHYGRWVWINGTGWAWIAGRRYADAWVEWRLPDDGYDYVGWAPLPPAWGWWDGAAVALWFAPPAAYVFCPSGDLFYYDVPRYIVHDHHRLGWVAYHSHRFRDSSGGVPHHAPAFSQAHVPPGARPAHHTPADPRALEASRPSTAGRALARAHAHARPSSFGGGVSAPRFRTRSLGSVGPSGMERRAPVYATGQRSFVRSARAYGPSVTYGSRRFYAPARRAYGRAPVYAGARFNPHFAPARYAPRRSYAPARSFSRTHFSSYHGGGFRGGFVHAARGRR
jgi:Family of unknown function (DUF6600)